MKKFILLAFSFLFVLSCTSDFDEINEKPDALTAADVSAKFFVTGVQQQFYAPNRYPYWRGPLIHFDRFSGMHPFGYKGNWWNDGMGYVYHAAYTNATWDWMSGYNSQLTAYTNFVKPGGTLENQQYYAIALIMKGLYYQRFSDVFGMVPFSEASDPDIVTPIFDDQKTIYDGIIAALDEAIGIIGSATTTGEGPQLLGENDLFFNGNMQDWKKLANSLKLKVALRGHGAGGADYSTQVSEAIAGGVLGDKDATIPRDIDISQWSSATYGDIWHNFYGGGRWHLGSSLVDLLRDNNDPRLTKYAKPIKGGTFSFTKPTTGDLVSMYDKHITYMKNHLTDSGVDYTSSVGGDGTVSITTGAGPYYVGQPSRTNGNIKNMLFPDLWSEPGEIVTQKKNEGKPIFPFLVFTAAESHFLLAHAATLGIGSGANSHYQAGITHAMRLWEVSDADIASYLANEPMGSLTGSGDLAKISSQRYLANYTDGLEAWAVIRDTGFPKVYKNTNGTGYIQSNTVNDTDIYEMGSMNGAYPQRLRYGSGAYNKNEANVNAAATVQGADKMETKLWWAK